MAVREILLLGNESLYKVSREVSRDEIVKAKQIVEDLHDTMMDFRRTYGFGRAIAAPQINEPFRIIYLNFDDNSIALINPRLEFIDDNKFEIWDDCMSFPGLEVRLYSQLYNLHFECLLYIFLFFVIFHVMLQYLLH